MKQIIVIFAFICSYLLCGAQATSLTIDNQTPGWLSSKINYGDQQTVQNLTVTGYLNPADLEFIGTLISSHSLSGSVDMENATLVDKDNKVTTEAGENFLKMSESKILRCLSLPLNLTSSSKCIDWLYVDTLIVGGENMKTIAEYGFSYSHGGWYSNNRIKHLILREGVEEIADNCFKMTFDYYSSEDFKRLYENQGYREATNLETIHLPSTIKKIGKKAFIRCLNLHSVNLPDGLEAIGEKAFRATSFQPDTLRLPSQLQDYDMSSFEVPETQVIYVPKETKGIHFGYNSTNYVSSKNKLIFHMANPNKPTVYSGSTNCLSNCIVYVPQGSLDSYKESDTFRSAKLIEFIEVKDIKFTFPKYTMYVEELRGFAPSFNPYNATDKDLTWRSSNPEIASVDNNGNVTALKYGQTQITATTKDGLHSSSFTLDVYEHVSSIELQKSLTLVVGANEKLSVSLLPNGTYEKIEWESSNNDIATVDNNGNVKGVSKGTCTITATAIDGGHTAECLVTVVQPVESVQVSPKEVNLKAGEGSNLTATILPMNANDKTITWKSSDENIVKVYSDGLITGISGGTANVFAISNYDNELMDYCKVTVIQPVTGIMLNEASVEITEDGSIKLLATILPENSTNKNVAWSSSDVSIAMVAGDGTVYGIKPGQATIMATTEDGGYSALCKVRVIPGFTPVSEIRLGISEINGKETEEYKISATVLPENASNKSLLWQSDNEKVVSVDNTGLAKLLNKGYATITVSATDGSNVFAQCAVIVNEASGIESILSDKQAYVRIFNLSGVLVYEGAYAEANLKADTYIVLCDGKSIKTVIE